MTARHRFIWSAALMIALAAVVGAQTPSEEAVLLQFQRAADSYAFGHRQAERRSAAPPATSEGTMFTPQVSAAFRTRIRSALAGPGCALPGDAARDFTVPRVNASVDGTAALPSCIAATLPALPPELEYRVAGVALVLADAHLHIAVDVLHAAFPRPAAP